MHMYSNTSNARAAARKFIDKNKLGAQLDVAMPVRAPVEQMFFYAAFALKPEAELAADVKAKVEDFGKLVEADDTPEEDDDEPVAPAPKAKRAAKKAPAKKAKAKPKSDRVNKTARARELMSRKNGASAEELLAEFGWEPHTLRGFISIKNNADKTDPPWDIETIREKDKPTRYIIR